MPTFPAKKRFTGRTEHGDCLRAPGERGESDISPYPDSHLGHRPHREPGPELAFTVRAAFNCGGFGHNLL